MSDLIPLSRDEREAHAKALYKLMQKPLAQLSADVLVTNFRLLFGIEREFDETEVELVSQIVSQFITTIGMMARLDALGIDERRARMSDAEAAEQIKRLARDLPSDVITYQLKLDDGAADV